MPSLDAGAVNDEERESAPGGIFCGELGGDFGISVAEKSIVWINDDVILLYLIHHWIGAARGNHDVFDTVGIQIRCNGGERDRGTV
jgi:hypothetical protein